MSLDVGRLAAAINDAQVQAAELQFGRDLTVPAARIARAYGVTTPPVPSLDDALREALTEIADGTTPDRIGRYDLLRDWVHHRALAALAALDRADVPAAPEEERLRAAAQDVLDAVEPVQLGPGMQRTPTVLHNSPSIERLRAALAVQPADRADVVDERLDVDDGLPSDDTSGLALVLEWRAFSDRFMDPAYRDDPERFHIRDAFAAGWDAALSRLAASKATGDRQ